MAETGQSDPVLQELSGAWAWGRSRRCPRLVSAGAWCCPSINWCRAALSLWQNRTGIRTQSGVRCGPGSGLCDGLPRSIAPQRPIAAVDSWACGQEWCLRVVVPPAVGRHRLHSGARSLCVHARRGGVSVRRTIGLMGALAGTRYRLGAADNMLSVTLWSRSATPRDRCGNPPADRRACYRRPHPVA